MKNTLPLLLLALTISTTIVDAQSTFANYACTNFAASGGGRWQTSTNLSIPANTLAKFIGIQTAGNVTNVSLLIQNPGLPPVPADWQTDDILNTPILGPCNVTVTTTAKTSANTMALFLVQFDPVNGSPALGGVIQPAGFAAVISLETSTNLASWEPMTNASFPRSAGNRFFRTSLTMP